MPKNKSAKTVSTTNSTAATPKKRGRIPTPLNITKKVGIGMSYAIERLSDGAIVRASSCCQRDRTNPESKMFEKQVSQYSGSNPFFTLKLNAAKVGVKYIKMLCSASLPHCEDTKNEYRWINLSLKEALAQKMDVDQSGFYVSSSSEPKAEKKAVKAKAVKPAKSKKVRKSKVVVEDTTAPVASNTNEDEAEIEKTAALVSDAAEVPTQKAPEQTDEEFAAELEAEHESEIARIMKASSQQS